MRLRRDSLPKKGDWLIDSSNYRFRQVVATMSRAGQPYVRVKKYVRRFSPDGVALCGQVEWDNWAYYVGWASTWEVYDSVFFVPSKVRRHVK